MRNRYVLLADLAGIAAAAAAAFAFRFDVLHFTDQPGFLPYLVAALVLKPVVFYVGGLYRRYWQYTSITDLGAVFVAVVAAAVAMAVVVGVWRVTGVLPSFSRTMPVLDGLMTLLAAGGVRVGVRLWAERRRRGRNGHLNGEAKRVLVVGAGQAGTMVARELERNPELGKRVVGYLDDDASKQGRRILGLPVLGSTEQLLEVASRERIAEVVIAMPIAPGAVVRRVSEDCRRAGLPSQTVPGVFELLDGKVTVNRLRQVEITDLLRRAPVPLNPHAAAYVKGRVVLVTGAGGSIGSELCRQVAHAGASEVVLLGHGENSIFEALVRLREQFPAAKLTPVIADIRDRERIRRVFERFRPASVFHAAAHKHVPLMEDNPEEAVTNNVFGTKNVVDAALAAGTERFVLISTDKAASPTSVMGATKRLAGEIVRAAAAESGRAFVVVRFGNVLGSRGSVVPIFKRQIERGGPVTVTHPDVKRFFMTIPEAVHLVLQAGGLGKGGELYVLNMGEPVRIVDLARDLIRLSGFSETEIPISFVGLKPGEKLEEELWERGAKVEPTLVAEVLRVVERETSRRQELAGAVMSGAVIDPGQLKGEILRAIRTGRPTLSDRGASPRRDVAVLSPVSGVPDSPSRIPGVACGDRRAPRAQEPAASVQRP